MNGQVVVMVFLDLNQDVMQVVRRMGGVRAGGIRIRMTVIRVPVVHQEYLVGHI